MPHNRKKEQIFTHNNMYYINANHFYLFNQQSLNLLMDTKNIV